MGAIIILFLCCLAISIGLGGGEGLAVGLFVGALVILFIVAVSRNNARNEEKAAQDSMIEAQKIHKDLDYSFSNSANNISIRFIVDNREKKVLISQTSSAFTRIPFSEIIGCEILTDSEITGGVGRAVVGSVLAGGVGAVVGSTTAKKKITSYQIIIYKNNINIPSLTLSLINKETKTTDLDYREAVKFAYNVNASIKAIIEQTKQPVIERSVAETTPKGIDQVQEIRKYKQLLDDGIITQEEFDRKKQQLLEL